MITKPSLLAMLTFTLLVSLCGGQVFSQKKDLPKENLPKERLTTAELSKVKAAEQARITAINKVYGAVVAIYGNTRKGGGSGVIYDPEGYALTNYHVVKGAGKEGWGGLADGKMYRWKLIGVDPGGDVAIIKLTGKKQFPSAKLGNSDDVNVGDFVMAMGNPFLLAEDQKPTVTLGIVSGVKRFQAGQGNNMLIYGNCIQVDSSINPGNSGGPLFNMEGEVIGINGRGSFKERGRVNVGVGYAISIEQIKNFLPELLATKVCLHGTLNAVFTNRRAGVICSQLNLDSRVADLGLQLGDELISFDHHLIEDANDLTNLVTTVPAQWPVELIFKHRGLEKTIWVRLRDLPYGPVKKNTQRPKPRPKPGKPGKPIKPVPVKPPTATPGKIGNKIVNAREANRVLQKYLTFTGGKKLILSTAAYTYEDDVLRDGKRIGQMESIIAMDGRLRVNFEIDGKKGSYGYDGKQYWAGPNTQTPGVINSLNALDQPHLLQAVILASILRESTSKTLGKIELQGADKTQGIRSYRLRFLHNDDIDVFAWFSLFDATGQPEVRLLKVAIGTAGEPANTGISYSKYRKTDDLLLPHRRKIVRNLSEQVQLEFLTRGYKIVSQLSDEQFQNPASVVEKSTVEKSTDEKSVEKNEDKK